MTKVIANAVEGGAPVHCTGIGAGVEGLLGIAASGRWGCADLA